MESAETRRLLALDGVEAIYDARDESGRPCRRILVRSLRDLPESLPSTLDGYPVEVRESGTLGPRGDA